MHNLKDPAIPPELYDRCGRDNRLVKIENLRECEKGYVSAPIVTDGLKTLLPRRSGATSKEADSMTSPLPTTEIDATCDVYERLETMRRQLVCQRKKIDALRPDFNEVMIIPDPTNVSMNDVICELLELWDFERVLLKRRKKI